MKHVSGEVIAELEDIRRAAGGFLRPTDVVERARNERSVLHSRFEWDDSEAAHQYRLDQARRLIRLCVTVEPVKQTEYRMYVSLTNDRDADGGYRNVAEVLSDESLARTMLEEALTELRRLEQKYRRLQELVPVFEAVKKVRRKTRRKPAKTGRK
jgi:hypothetical protein